MSDNTVPEWFATALEALRTNDVPGWMAMYADDAVHEFPFALSWMPSQLQGKEAITVYMAAVPSTVSRDAITISRVRQTSDELIVAGSVDGSMMATGKPLHVEFVWFIKHDTGRVSRFQDYMNPLAFMDDTSDADPEPQ